MEYPLISAIMPTRNRHEFLPQALKYFYLQDYPHKELIIVDDSDEPTLTAEYPDVRYVYISEPLTIGMKRNIAVSLAHGEYIAHTDDDDIFGPERLSKQIVPILRGEATLTAFRMSLLLQTHTGTLVECPEHIHERLFPSGVRAGTLLYPKRFWNAMRSYENRNTGEDAAFLRELLELYDVLPITDPASYICVRHGGNVTHDLDISGWKQVPMEQYLSEEDRSFYGQLREAIVT